MFHIFTVLSLFVELGVYSEHCINGHLYLTDTSELTDLLTAFY